MAETGWQVTRRSATTICVQLTLRIPPGGKPGQMLNWITSALLAHKARENPQTPISAIDLDSMIVKLTKRETTYL